MEYIVLDLEWNQPDYHFKDRIPITSEIIQIGAVKTDEQFNMLDTFKILVKPVVYEYMHRKVERLTGITREDLEFGFPFQTAFKYFCDWCGDEFCLLSWGPEDIFVLKENMFYHHAKMGMNTLSVLR